MIFQDLSDSEQSKVKEVIQRLMEVNLLIKDKDRELYATIRRYRTALEGYYRFLGWELVVDERHECVYLHIPDGRLRRRLDREQTLWLLVLRLLYEEKRQGLSLADYPMITLYEIRSKYETFRLEWVNRTALDRLVRLCVQAQLIEPLDSDIRSDDARFKLFHTWIYMIQTDEMQSLLDKLELYLTNAEGGLLDEMDEAAASD